MLSAPSVFFRLAAHVQWTLPQQISLSAPLSNPGGRRLGGRFQVKDPALDLDLDLGRPLFDVVGF